MSKDQKEEFIENLLMARNAAFDACVCFDSLLKSNGFDVFNLPVPPKVENQHADSNTSENLNESSGGGQDSQYEEQVSEASASTSAEQHANVQFTQQNVVHHANPQQNVVQHQISVPGVPQYQMVPYSMPYSMPYAAPMAGVHVPVYQYPATYRKPRGGKRGGARGNRGRGQNAPSKDDVKEHKASQYRALLEKDRK